MREIKVPESKTLIEINSRAIEISICFDCKNARAHMCEWVDNLKPVWNKAFYRKVNVHKKANGQIVAIPYNIYIVAECPNFVMDEKSAKCHKASAKKKKG